MTGTQVISFLHRGDRRSWSPLAKHNECSVGANSLLDGGGGVPEALGFEVFPTGTHGKKERKQGGMPGAGNRVFDHCG
jgi:hypothetical protein